MSDSLQPYELQHTRPPCPSPIPVVCPNSCSLSRWCRSTVSSFVVPFSSCLQSFPASGSFQMSHLFASGGQRIGVSASTSVLPMNTQDWSPLGWTGWISLCPRDSQESSPTPQFKSINSSAPSFLYSPTLTSIHDYWKTIALTRWTFVGKVVSLLFNMLSRLVITFLPRSECLLISWLQSSYGLLRKCVVAQLYPTFCNPVDCNLPASSVHGILQVRILEWVAISFSRDLPNPGIEPGSPASQADALPSEPPGRQAPYMDSWGPLNHQRPLVSERITTKQCDNPQSPAPTEDR